MVNGVKCVRDVLYQVTPIKRDEEQEPFYVFAKGTPELQRTLAFLTDKGELKPMPDYKVKRLEGDTYTSEGTLEVFDCVPTLTGLAEILANDALVGELVEVKNVRVEKYDTTDSSYFGRITSSKNYLEILGDVIPEEKDNSLGKSARSLLAIANKADSSISVQGTVEKVQRTENNGRMLRVLAVRSDSSSSLGYI
jgi:hypothetical protein